MMEISCTLERVGLVKNFFEESKISAWPDDFNTLIEPDTPLDETSAPGIKRQISHLIKVPTYWWKAAIYVQNRDREECYTRITGRVVKSPVYLYSWPKYIKDVTMDAPEEEESKKNPKISFEYEDGHEFLADSTQHKPTMTRLFVTGGSLPPSKSAKRHIPTETSTVVDKSRKGATDQQQTRILEVEDIESPMNFNK